MGVIAAITSYIRNVVESIWHSISTMFTAFMEWLLKLLNAVGIFLVDSCFGLLAWLIGLLPDKFDLPSAGAVPEIFSRVNYYVPLTEGVVMFGLWAGIVAVLMAIKWVKFLRGGG